MRIHCNGKEFGAIYCPPETKEQTVGEIPCLLWKVKNTIKHCNHRLAVIKFYYCTSRPTESFMSKTTWIDHLNHGVGCPFGWQHFLGGDVTHTSSRVEVPWQTKVHLGEPVSFTEVAYGHMGEGWHTGAEMPQRQLCHQEPAPPAWATVCKSWKTVTLV